VDLGALRVADFFRAKLRRAAEGGCLRLDHRPLRASRWNYQRLLHCRNIRAAKLGFGLVQLVHFLGLVVGLHEQFEREGIVLIFLQMFDGFRRISSGPSAACQPRLATNSGSTVAAAIGQQFATEAEIFPPARFLPLSLRERHGYAGCATFLRRGRRLRSWRDG